MRPVPFGSSPGPPSKPDQPLGLSWPESPESGPKGLRRRHVLARRQVPIFRPNWIAKPHGLEAIIPGTQRHRPRRNLWPDGAGTTT
ncbi:hypothetical protein M0R45_036087 [Rubus argutus]|uniref:Uncharacterized protein n=1 Tax=Rubus argutus TaxID=59490 RepID=A0AAW1VYT7_RUBAR